MIDTDITDTVAIKLDASDLAPEVRDRLRPCLPVLSDAITNWQAAGSFSAPGILVAAATPTSFSLTHSECWATNVDHLDRDVVLVALVKAIELQEAALLVAALSAVLGKTGRASAEADARAISGRGELPLLVVLAAASQDAEVAVMATTVAVPCPAEPSVTLH
jgi:hypothetical protein